MHFGLNQRLMVDSRATRLEYRKLTPEFLGERERECRAAGLLVAADYIRRQIARKEGRPPQPLEWNRRSEAWAAD